MEDAATAEISRTQVWQWMSHGAKLADGRRVTADLVRRTMTDELGKLRDQLGADRFDAGKFDLASTLFDRMMTGTDFPDFLTTVAYDYID
jgi:malate synthase